MSNVRLLVITIIVFAFASILAITFAMKKRLDFVIQITTEQSIVHVFHGYAPKLSRPLDHALVVI